MSGKVLGLSDSDHPDRPLSSVTARRRAEKLESTTGEADIVEPQRSKVNVVTLPSRKVDVVASDVSNSARVAAIQREYIQMDVKKLWHFKTMPAADNEDSGEFTTALITSIRRTVRNILQWLMPRVLRVLMIPTGLTVGKRLSIKLCIAPSIAARRRRRLPSRRSSTDFVPRWTRTVPTGPEAQKYSVVWRGDFPATSTHQHRQVPSSVSVLLAWPLMFLFRTISDNSSW